MNQIISENKKVDSENSKQSLVGSANSQPRPEYDLTGKIIGLAMKVHRTLGPGFLESIYQKALLFELARSGFKVSANEPIQVFYEGVVVGDFKADLLVNDELVIELKAVSTIIVEHEVQLVNYLAATGKETGLLLNFGSRRLEFKKKFRNSKPEEKDLHK